MIYHPRTPQEAVNLRKEHADTAVYLAGGTDDLRLGGAAPGQARDAHTGGARNPHPPPGGPWPRRGSFASAGESERCLWRGALGAEADPGRRPDGAEPPARPAGEVS